MFNINSVSLSPPKQCLRTWQARLHLTYKAISYKYNHYPERYAGTATHLHASPWRPTPGSEVASTCPIQTTKAEHPL